MNCDQGGTLKMILLMRPEATERQVEQVFSMAKKIGASASMTRTGNRKLVAICCENDKTDLSLLDGLACVEKEISVENPFPLASRQVHPKSSVVKVGKAAIGANAFVVMAGPCAVEGMDQMLAAAQAVQSSGARILRGGAFKPRSSPYSFQGLEREGLEILREVSRLTGMPIVTECISVQDLPWVVQYSDMVQIGARSMQNFDLLEEVGRIEKPVLLKRGMMSSLEELLMSAEHIMSKGNSRVVLCERGIRTFERYTRNTLDIAAVPVLQRLTHLPVIVDPSHSGGRRDLAGPLSLAAAAAGADGLLIEVHPSPEDALCDGPQSISPSEFAQLMKQLGAVAKAVGRKL
jgi:3-deoxy-7-phosphoheptulonate synthase